MVLSKFQQNMLNIALLFSVSKEKIDKYRRAGIQPKVGLTLVIPFPFQNRLKLSSEVNVRGLARSHRRFGAAECSLDPAFQNDERLLEIVTMRRWAAARRNTRIDQAKAARGVGPRQKNRVGVAYQTETDRNDAALLLKSHGRLKNGAAWNAIGGPRFDGRPAQLYGWAGCRIVTVSS
jgi:hypothetical protein